MADGATSVGKVQLDVEFSKNSLGKEIKDLEKAFDGINLTGGLQKSLDGFTQSLNNFIKKDITNLTNSIRESADELSKLKTPTTDTESTERSFKGMFSRIRMFSKQSVNKAAEDMNNFAQTGTAASEKVSRSVNKLNAEYEKTEAKIRELRNELAKLLSEQDSIARGYQGLPAFSGMSKDESMEQMLKSDAGYQKLSAEIDKLTAKMDPLISKNKTLKQEINNAGSAAESTGRKFSFLSRNKKDAGNEAEKASRKINLFGREMKSSGTKASGFGNMISKSLGTILRRLFVYNLIMKGIRGVMSYMGAALNTNAQFVHSLNIIKTNLRVAFQPIFEFILPAINTLMRAVATATTYIATAISALFGKSYKQSFNAAKGMNKVMDSMKNAGKAAKKTGKDAKKAGEDAKKALAGFDEINNLDLGKDKTSTPDAGSGGDGGFEMAMPDMSQIDMTGINKFKDIMAKIFEPFKKAWENEGKATIEAAKYAFASIRDMGKAIGRSWLEVWTNGSGQRMLETILRIIQNIFNLVGNLATQFTKAWEKNKVGTRIVQGIFDIINNIWGTIEKITKATADWAKELDFYPLLESIDKLLRALEPITKNIGDGLAWLWKNVLLPIAGWAITDAIPSFLNMIAKALDFLNVVLELFKPLGMWLWENFLKPLGNWAGSAVLDILDGLAYAFEKIGDYLSRIGEIIGDSDGFLDALFNVGEYLFEGLIMGLAHGIAGIGTWLWDNIVSPIIDGVKNLFGIKSPSTVFAAIGKDLIEGLKVGLKKTWDAIPKFFKEGLGKLKTSISNKWNEVKTDAGRKWEEIKTTISGKWNNIRTTASTTFENIKSTISGKWNSIKTNASTTWENIKTSLSGTWENIKTTAGTKFGNIRTSISDAVSGAAESASTQTGRMRGFFDNLRLKLPKPDILGVIRSAVDPVSGQIDRLRNFFANLKLTIPKPKMPRFSLTGRFSLMPPSVPRLNVDWYDKGGIFTGPQVIGVGEKRPEFVGALDDLREIVRDEIVAALGVFAELLGGDDEGGDLVLEIDGDEFARIAIKVINKRRRKAGLPLLEE